MKILIAFTIFGIVCLLAMFSTNIIIGHANAALIQSCTGNPHDLDSGPTGNPHDGRETGNPHDINNREHDGCPGTK